jgi:hypothetical protein
MLMSRGCVKRLPDQVLNAVCFIAKSAAKDSYRATGFIASVAGAHGNACLYLATAKHVAASVAWEPFIIGFNHHARDEKTI